MNTLIIIFVSIISLAVSYYVSNMLSRHRKFHYLKERTDRLGAIDGLRGYLALLVFIHHFEITWYWHNTGEWSSPPYLNFGTVGVSIFFMITGYLFVHKILTNRRKYQLVSIV